MYFTTQYFSNQHINEPQAFVHLHQFYIIMYSVVTYNIGWTQY